MKYDVGDFVIATKDIDDGNGVIVVAGTTGVVIRITAFDIYRVDFKTGTFGGAYCYEGELIGHSVNASPLMKALK